MGFVRAKKHLGQHFLINDAIAAAVVQSLPQDGSYQKVIEVGPGTGVLTRHLEKTCGNSLFLIDIDSESIAYLHEHYPALSNRIIEGDILKLPLDEILGKRFAIIGNFPYNISSQILFRVLEFKHLVPYVVGMFQEEVGKRICSPPGNRDYGILSVLMQAHFTTEYLFDVGPHEFNPPPKVNSGVVRFSNKFRTDIDYDEVLFKRIVKAGFNQRRKKLSNALKSLGYPITAFPYSDLRAEQLSFTQFEELTHVFSNRK